MRTILWTTKFLVDTTIVIGLCSIATAFAGVFEPRAYCGIGPSMLTQVVFYGGLCAICTGILGHFLHKSKSR